MFKKLLDLLKRKKVWIPLIVILIAIGGGVYYYETQVSAKQVSQSSGTSLNTAVVRQGQIIVFASGAGQIVPASEINLGFDDSGTLTKLNVEVGDKVKTGDVLATLQTKNTEESIQASVTAAELAVTQAQNALDDLYNNAEISRTSALNDISTYAQEVRDAQYQMDNYTIPDVLQGMDAIQGLDKMKQALDAARAAFEPYKYQAQDNKLRNTLLEALNVAQINYNSAVKRLEYEYVLEVAQANLDKARQTYDSYKDGPAPGELTQAQNELASAKAQLAEAKSTQAVLNLVAPMDGTIVTVDANVGEYVGTTAIITLADLNKVELDVSLDETDLDKVAVGYSANVTFDALPDKTYTGKVTAVNPTLQDVSNVQTIVARVVLDQTGIDPGVTLPIGLNASVDVIAGQADNAILIPVEALRQIAPNEYAVFVVENGELKLHTVTIGLQDLTSVQILSGLTAGQIVSTGAVETKQGQ
jgi:HlyD family secretion protein